MPRVQLFAAGKELPAYGIEREVGGGPGGEGERGEDEAACSGVDGGVMVCGVWAGGKSYGETDCFGEGEECVVGIVAEGEKDGGCEGVVERGAC